MPENQQAFIIQQVGASDSPERRRADEIYEGIIVPAVESAGLRAYRADLDPTPGAITPKMLSELLAARVVIADLTGRNPNVFYELGITHSFVRPLISVADFAKSLPFDAKDERVIELGEYPSTGLGLRQGQRAISGLREALRIVLSEDYAPSSPLKEVAANVSVDQLAPENPVAAEMAQIRETLEEIRKKVTPRSIIPSSLKEDLTALRRVIMDHAGDLDPWDVDSLSSEKNSAEQRTWAKSLHEAWESSTSKKNKSKVQGEDPWATVDNGGYSDEPPF